MQLKLDENLSPDFREPLVRAGHDVATVYEQRLGGADDPKVAEGCKREGRCLVTADQDFAQIIDYPPEQFAGIVVLRHPQPTLQGMRDLVAQLAVAVERESPIGRLWIVEPGRIRIHDRDETDPA